LAGLSITIVTNTWATCHRQLSSFKLGAPLFSIQNSITGKLRKAQQSNSENKESQRLRSRGIILPNFN